MSLDTLVTTMAGSLDAPPTVIPPLAATAGDLVQDNRVISAGEAANLPTGTLVFDAATPLDTATKAILNRPLSFRYDDAVVVGPDGVFRALAVTPVFEELARHFAYRALHDTVTGLPNRVLLAEHMQTLLNRQRFRMDGPQPALLCIELDGFKGVGEEHGHEVGEEILRQFADRLRNLSRPGDVVARLAGNEYALLLASTVQPAHALAIADRVVLAAASPFFVGERVLHLGASVGVACLATDAAEHTSRPVDLLLQHAEEAMHLARRGGRGRAQLYDMAAAARARSHRAGEGLARELRGALINGELELHYQPKVNLPAGWACEVEALARWQHPRRGAISPAEFIPVAERNGLIGDVGRWALREACRQARVWSDELAAEDPTLRPPVVAVNVSPYQLADPQFVNDVADALAEHGLDPDRLSLEITESAAVDDLPSTVERLRALKSLGVTLSLDDFGTGYSSLTLMRQLPIDCVKIDKSFVDNIDSSPAEAVLVRLVIEAAHCLGLTVCAEGIERAAQLDQLLTSGCDSVQGFLLGVPAPAGLTDPRPHSLLLPQTDDGPGSGNDKDAGGPLLPGSGQLVALSTPQGVLTYVSAESVTMLGYQPSELVGRCIAEFLTPEDRRRFESGSWSGAGCLRSTLTYRLRHRDGHDVWVETDNRAGLDPRTQRATEVLSTVRDVSEQTGTQRALADRDRRLQAAFNSSPVGISLTGIDGRLLQVNPALCAILGRTEAELVGTQVRDLVHPDDPPDRALFEQLLAGERSEYRITRHFLLPNGNTAWASVLVTGVNDSDGSCAYVLAHVQDVNAQ